MRVWINIVLWAMLSLSYSATIKNLSWNCEQSNCYLQFEFANTPSLPSFFQAYDKNAQILKVVFANSNTDLPYAKLVLDNNSSGLKTLQIREEKSKGGIPLLAFIFETGKDIVNAENPTELVNKRFFRLKFPASFSNKAWDLNKIVTTTKSKAKVKNNTKTTPDLAAQAKPLAKTDTIAEVEQQATVKEEIVPGITKVSWLRGAGVEHFYVEFTDPLKFLPEFRGEKTLRLFVEGAKILSKVNVDGSFIVENFRIIAGPLNTVVLSIELKDENIQVLSRNNSLLLQKSVPFKEQIESWNWGTDKEELKVFYNYDSEVPESLEAFAKQFKVTKNKETFALKSVSRDLIVVADKGTALRENPNGASTMMRDLPFGSKLTRLELVNNLFYKVKYGNIIGYVNRREVSSPHELSHKQAEKLQELASSKQKEDPNTEEDSEILSFVFDDEFSDRISYQSFGRRDPFIPLQGVVVDGINIDGVELVGIIWEPEAPMVILSDMRNSNLSYTLKEGDAILNGKVLKITQDEVLFIINEVGVSRRYTMTLPDKYGGRK
ncbi:MAG: SH3 domain-containing protein [Fibrobacter sp.]|nr:SH3 domain-containing protein [Fibrobacter sp.]